MHQLNFFFIGFLALLFPLQEGVAQECLEGSLKSTPTERFKVNDESTVTDEWTGLVWKRCLQGMSGTNCSLGVIFEGTWEQALQEVDANQGWRLPNIKELQSIVERQCIEPALNIQVFPGNTIAGVWSSSPNIHLINHNDTTNGWHVDFRDGAAYGFSIGDRILQVRLVRGGL